MTLNGSILPETFPAVTMFDLIALCFFIFSWAAYSYFAEHNKKTNLLNITNQYRLQWMREMLKREQRNADAIMVGNLLRSISFFANTTIFILIGLMTLLGYHDEISEIVTTIPFAEPTSGFMWEIKLFLLIILFIYAFFKYTWSLRQYNYAGIFIVAAPAATKDMVYTDEHEALARRGAWLVANAAKHFNNGLRAYYFGLAALSWFIHPTIFMAATAWVIFVTYRREFRSGTLSNLSGV